MRALVITLSLVAATAPCLAEEAYVLTGRAHAACLGTNMRVRYESPKKLLETLNTKCSKLEDQEKEQYAQYLTEQIGRPLTAELVLVFVMRETLNPFKLKHMAIDAYFSAVKPTPKVGPPLQLDR
jgi:hypothetical protein